MGAAWKRHGMCELAFNITVVKFNVLMNHVSSLLIKTKPMTWLHIKEK
jgi:hypothetical protein